MSERGRGGVRGLEGWGRDLRHALRLLRRSPGFMLAGGLTLALGIGANTAMFSVVDGVLLRPLPYRDPGRLVAITTHRAGSPAERNPASLPDIRDWQQRSRVFSGLAGYAFNREELGGPEGPDEVLAVIGTADLFPVLGSGAEIGRTLGPSDDHAPVVVLSHRLWMARYGGSTAVLGRSVDMGGAPYTIVGVMPPGFHFPSPSIDMWTSMAPIYAVSGKGAVADWVHSRSLRGYGVVARLRPGIEPAVAQASLNGIETDLGRLYPEDDGGIGVSLQSLRAATLGGVERALWVLLGATGLVLLIACVNIAHLQLARGTGREAEIALRRALGAERGHVLRQLLTESLVLALCGGAAGVLLAVWGTPALVHMSPGNVPGLERVAVNAPVLALALATSAAVGLACGLWPALRAWQGARASGAALSGARGVGRNSHGGRLRSAFMATEVALAVVLVIGAGLMLRSFARLVATSPGFPTDHLLTFELSLPRPDAAAAAQLRLVDRVLERVRGLPGVAAAGASTSLPPNFHQEADPFDVDGRPAPPPSQAPVAWYVPSTPDYLRALGTPLYAGREFTDADGPDAAPVTIVNRALARRAFGAASPVGQHITVRGVSRVVVGVVGDVSLEGLAAPVVRPEIFVPFAQSPFPGLYVAIRTTGDAGSVAVGVGAAVRSVDPELHPQHLATMHQLLAGSVVGPRFQTLLLGSFGILALVLAAVGIYGVIATWVGRRTGEIGLRMALGATKGSVLGLVVRQGMAPVVAGLGLGLVASLLATRLLAALLYGVGPTDPATFAGVLAVLAVVALVAAWVPARRAARVDPMEALRHE